jgi:hypothetical protein
MQRLTTIVLVAAALLLVGVLTSFSVWANDETALPAAAESAGSSSGESNTEITAKNDGGAEDADAGAPEPATAEPLSPEVESDKAVEDEEKTAASPELSEEEAAAAARQKRRYPTDKRHPGSYMGGAIGYTMANSWYRVEISEYEREYDLGPLHGTSTIVRVGDAFFEWFAVGFQIDLVSANNFYQSKEKMMSGFGLYLDTTFYPWRGFGLRPSVGLGFSYAQTGTDRHEFGFGGPASLSFAVTYEFRLPRLFTLGPVFQIAWTAGEDYNAMFFTVGIELLKWFMTPEG